MHVRDAIESDIDFLMALEVDCFPAHRRSTRRSIRNSILRPGQRVLIVEDAARSVCIGAATLFYYKKTVRLYSIAILPAHRGSGAGYFLLQHVLTDARERHYSRVTLEADAADEKLLQWYRRCGFQVVLPLPDYYAEGESAVRMVYSVTDPVQGGGTGNVIVVDRLDRWPMLEIPGVEVVGADAYLAEERFRNSERFHVLNLCSSYKSHSVGYYVSLLGTARNHRILPTVTTVNDMRNLAIAQRVVEEIEDYLIERLQQVGTSEAEITVLLGFTPDARFSELGRKLFALFQLPFFVLRFGRGGADTDWRLRRITVLNLSMVLLRNPEQVRPALTAYFDRKRYRRARLKQYRYDLAILVNQEEKTPPSCQEALRRFRWAAEQTGFAVEFIGKMDYRRIGEFDALFIRETTAIENHTYRFARRAYTEGLVVVDDPWSILYCSNKIYLHERLARGRVRQPQTWLMRKEHLAGGHLTDQLMYPLVLKLPESAFSLGVYRVDDEEQLRSRLRQMLAHSDLVIAQAFVETAFDWRIGIMDHTPLFACKYFMAQGHWQIYNWHGSEADAVTGKHETVPIDVVPKAVIKAALKSSALIGDGLYGVDLKEVDGQAVVIEINDNPNIDRGVEDALIGDDVYLRIMASMFARIEKERNRPRYLL